MISSKVLFDELPQIYIECEVEDAYFTDNHCQHFLSNFRISHCNKFTEQICSNKLNSSSSLFTLFHESEHADIKSILSKTHGEKTASGQHRWVKSDGSLLQVRWQLTFFADEKRAVFTGQDVTKETRLASAFKVIEDATETGYWEIDNESGKVYWSEKVHEIHETSPDTFVPQLDEVLKFYHPDAIPILKQHIADLEQNDQPFTAQLKFLTARNKELIVGARGFAERVNGKAIRTYGTFRDLTLQKLEEQEKKTLEQRVIMTLQAAKIGLWNYDIRSDKLEWDDRLFGIYGKEKEEFTHDFKFWESCLHPDDVPEAVRKFHASIENDTYYNHTFRVITNEGKIRHVLGIASTIFDIDGTPIKSTGINIDLSESEEAKIELKKAKEKAEKLASQAKMADLQKSVFLAHMSHELRTPISSIIGLLDILHQRSNQASSLNKESEEYFQLLKQSANDLLGIISDILDFSKIEVGNIALEKQHVNLQNIVDEIKKTAQIKALGKNVEIEFSQNKRFTSTVHIDPLRIKQIYYNLINNAFKFTEKGKIKVSTELIVEKNDKANLRCIVEDTGIGISEKDIKRLFNPFVQINSRPGYSARGAGLGLSIVERLCKLMGGAIDVKSELKKGSKFVVSLPVKITQEQSTNLQKTSPLLRNERLIEADSFVLVAEDNDINQLIIGDLLKQIGVPYMMVADGEAALKALKSRHGKKVKAIIMDCQMPRLDGFETTYAIRNERDYSDFKTIPIIALTANAMINDKEKCLNAGMDLYLTKPVRKEQLADALSEVRRGESGSVNA